jgi:DNA-binding IclR family transcriptional regulator
LNSPQSVARVIQILEALCANPRPISLADLSRSIAAPKSSVAALLRGLVAADIVVSATGAYRLGSGAFGLGSALLEARRRLQSSDFIREGMRRLAERCGETVLFGVREPGSNALTYVDIVESRKAVRFTVSVGDRRPLFCTSGGRILLAVAPEEELRLYLNRLRPRRLTATTETNKRRIAQSIAVARASGVAQTLNQTSLGVFGTAAAIFDATGTAIGALIVAAPHSRLQERSTKLASAVLEEAATISRNLGHRTPTAHGTA